MEIDKIINERYSVRNFSDQYVDVKIILEMMELVRMAPSAVNFQPWHFIVITEKERLEALWPVYHRSWFQNAPMVVVACVNHDESWKRGNDGHDFGEVDVAIAVDHLTLAATSRGLGTCWVCNFDTSLCREILHLPGFMDPLVLVPLGYPAGDIPAKKRKTREEIMSWEVYGNRKSVP